MKHEDFMVVKKEVEELNKRCYDRFRNNVVRVCLVVCAARTGDDDWVYDAEYNGRTKKFVGYRVDWNKKIEVNGYDV